MDRLDLMIFIIPFGQGPLHSMHFPSGPAILPGPQSLTHAPRSAIKCAEIITEK